MLRGVILDLDGVIIDSHPIHKKAWRRFLRSVGKKASGKDLEFVLDGRKKEDILRHFLGDLTPEQVLQYGHQKELIFREEASSITLIKGSYEFIQQLRQAGISVAVASSGSNGRVRYILEHIDLLKCFHAVVTGDDVPNGKPDPSIFRRAAKGLGHSPAELLVVEDGISGVQAAKSAGMKCLGIAKKNRQRLLLTAGADLVVPNFVGLTIGHLHRILE